MSRVSKKMPSKHSSEEVTNFMGGTSYTISPIQALKLVASSSMFGEPKYYQKEESCHERPIVIGSCAKKMLVIDGAGKLPSQYTLEAIDKALAFDFKKTLELASELRNEYNIRFVPQLIMVKAAMHPSRVEFDEKNPGFFSNVEMSVMKRADEPAAQLACWLWLHGWKKNGIPSVLKRAWKKRVEMMTPYQVSKYKNAETGLINLVRICHACGDTVSELMKTGTVTIEETEKTWENLRSAGSSFLKILETIKMPHMALIRNLRNILNENPPAEVVDGICESLKKGASKGEQFPFRYYSAKKEVAENCMDAAGASKILDALDECIDISTDILPKIKGRTAVLTDNSGSAWGAFTSEYGSRVIAEIDNISSVIAARQSDEGVVIKFGDDVKKFPVSKRDGVLTQAEKISADRDADVGGGTENGIWLFFKEAIEKKIMYDNIFVFSDQQAGHGGLYGIGSSYRIAGSSKDFSISARYIDVLKLLEAYRSKVNPKVNFFTVQTAGYSNAIVPEFIYRGAVLCGWTGKETSFAAKLIEQWDEIEAASSKQQKNN